MNLEIKKAITMLTKVAVTATIWLLKTIIINLESLSKNPRNELQLPTFLVHFVCKKKMVFPQRPENTTLFL